MPSINVIYGPPCAGKSLFAKSNKKNGDVVIDFDLIASALGSESKHDSKGSVRLVALSARLSAINRVMRGVEDDAYIIHTSPQEDLIKEYKEKKVHFILVDPGIETCLARAQSRPEGTEQAVRDWYNNPPKIEPSETVKDFNVMGKSNLDLMAEDLFLTIKSYVDTSGIRAEKRLDEIEKSLEEIPACENGKDGTDGKDGKDGLDGVNGKDADEEAIIERCFAKMMSSDFFMQKMAEFASTKVLSSIQLPKDGKDGINGKDADPEFIRSEVAAAVAAIPVPENGKDGADGKDADESAIIEKVMSQIVMPQDGKSVTVDDVAPLIDELVTKRVAEIPAPKDGRDGKDADESAIVAKVVQLIPVPKDGKDGVDGKDVDIEYVRSQIENAVAAIPKPENGKDADPQLIREMVLTEVAKIPAPADGKSVTLDDVTPVLEVAVSRWAVDFERRAHDVLQTAVERLPKPKDGEKGDTGNDGFGIQDFVQRGDRTVVAIYKRGDETIEQEFKFPAVIDRGVFKSGSNYEQGDGVTYGGSFWIAQKDNSDIPGNSDAWRLAVKRGRDGKDAA
jgi:predicted kinase